MPAWAATLVGQVDVLVNHVSDVQKQVNIMQNNAKRHQGPDDQSDREKGE